MVTSLLLSSLLGYISLTCWIIVFVPQVYDNYRNKDVESISTLFIVLWLVGDSLNLIGAFMEGLLSTTIMLSIYFICSDLVILYQIYLYTKSNSAQVSSSSEIQQNKPLRDTNVPSYHSVEQSRASDVNEFKPLVKRAGSTFLKLGSLAALFYVLYVLINPPSAHSSPAEDKFNRASSFLQVLLTGPTTSPIDAILPTTIGALLGWCSTLLYWGARLPQLYLNYKRQSVEGLSISTFIFCVIGNLSFGFSVLIHPNAVDSAFILKNLPWLLGTMGTVFIDFLVLSQFYVYSRKTPSSDENLSCTLA